MCFQHSGKAKMGENLPGKEQRESTKPDQKKGIDNGARCVKNRSDRQGKVIIVVNNSWLIKQEDRYHPECGAGSGGVSGP